MGYGRRSARVCLRTSFGSRRSHEMRRFDRGAVGASEAALAAAPRTQDGHTQRRSPPDDRNGIFLWSEPTRQV